MLQINHNNKSTVVGNFLFILQATAMVFIKLIVIIRVGVTYRKSDHEL